MVCISSIEKRLNYLPSVLRLPKLERVQVAITLKNGGAALFSLHNHILIAFFDGREHLEAALKFERRRRIVANAMCKRGVPLLGGLLEDRNIFQLVYLIIWIGDSPVRMLTLDDNDVGSVSHLICSI